MAAGPAGAIAASVSESAWRDFVEYVAETVDVGPGTRVFDAGCGAGALLYPFHENGYVVGGQDASTERVRLARAAMPGGQFSVAELSSLDPAEPWDVVACSTFASIPDPDHARGVLARVAAKATHAVVILDVPEGRYDRRWMLRAFAEIGVSAVQMADVRVEGYADAARRFNLFARL